MSIINGPEEVHKDSFIGWALCQLLGQHSEILQNSDLKKLDVKITINGTEVDAVAFFNQLKGSFDYSVNEAARKMVGEKFNKLEDILYQSGEKIKAAINQIVPAYDKFEDD